MRPDMSQGFPLVSAHVRSNSRVARLLQAPARQGAALGQELRGLRSDPKLVASGWLPGEAEARG